VCDSHENYQALTDLGKTGDTFNDVLTKVLKNNYRHRDENVKESHDEKDIYLKLDKNLSTK
jgi:hypothetical protein